MNSPNQSDNNDSPSDANEHETKVLDTSSSRKEDNDKDEVRAESENNNGGSLALATTTTPDGEPRDTWGSHTSYIITCIGYVVGLGNIARFPYLCYKYGGGAFLIPYFLFLILLGVPIYFLEIFIGQYAGVGTMSAMEINPLFKGFGYTALLVCIHICPYYNVQIATAVYFVISSFQFDLPWTTCDNEWNTCYCKEMALENEIPRNVTADRCRDIIVTSQTRTSPSHEFFNNKLLEKSSGLTEPGGLKWDLTLCNLMVWIFVFCIISRGIRSIGKVAYVSTMLPYFILALILMRCITLPGAGMGIYYYLAVDLDKIMTFEVWRTAASQVVFSLGLSMGVGISLSSYNKFHENCLRDSFVVPLVDCFISLFMGLAVFAALGHMAQITGRDIDQVVASGLGLVYEVYPLVLAKLPWANMWTLLFFLMIVLLGLSSEIPFVEGIVTPIQDEYPYWRQPRQNVILRFILCMTFFTLGLLHTTRGGTYLTGIFDASVNFTLLSIGLLEVVIFIPMYGIERFANDVKLMLGYSVWNMRIFEYYLKWTLLFFTPLVFIMMIVTYIVEYQPISTMVGYPAWAESILWSLVVFELMWVPFGAIGLFCYRGGYKLLKDLTRPSTKWGPNLPTPPQMMPSPLSTDTDPPTGDNENDGRASTLSSGARSFKSDARRTAAGSDVFSPRSVKSDDNDPKDEYNDVILQV